MPCSKCAFLNTLSLKNIYGFFWLTQEYLAQLILPAGLRTLFVGNAILMGKVLLFLSFATTLYCLIKAAVFRKKVFAFGILLYFIGLIPAANLIDHIGYFGTILCEHYLYLASAGLFIIAAYLLIRLSHHLNKAAKACIAACFLFYICLTIINNTNYKDEITFYNHILNVDKEHSFVRVNLGNAYYTNKMYDKAIEQAKLTLALEPDSWDAYLLLENVFKAKGDITRAIGFYRKTIAFNPVSVEGYLALGITLAESDYNKEAETVLREALIRFPDSVDIMRNLGALYGNTGKLEEAVKIWQQALVLSPEDRILKNNIRLAKELLKKKASK
jgi:tetratricopeptide (TPR) repeat protein